MARRKSKLYYSRLTDAQRAMLKLSGFCPYCGEEISDSFLVEDLNTLSCKLVSFVHRTFCRFYPPPHFRSVDDWQDLIHIAKKPAAKKPAI